MNATQQDLARGLPPASQASGRKPWRPLTRLFFRLALGAKEERAVRWMVPIWFLAVLFRRSRRMDNLKLLHGPSHNDAARIRSLERQHIIYLSRMNLQIMRLSEQSPADLVQNVRVTGEEHVATALQKGRGMLLIISHAGTWWHAPLYLAARGHRLRAVANPELPPRIANYLVGIATKFGVPVTYVGTGAYHAAREAFEQKEIFVIAADRSLRVERSAWVRCGPAELPMDPGPAILALRQRVPVVQAETFHDDTGRSCINYSAPLSLGIGTPLNTPDALMRFWSQSLYEQWSRHPEQWWTLSFCSLRPSATLTSSPQIHRS